MKKLTITIIISLGLILTTVYCQSVQGQDYRNPVRLLWGSYPPSISAICIKGIQYITATNGNITGTAVDIEPLLNIEGKPMECMP